MQTRRRLAIASITAVALAAWIGVVHAGGDWNDAQVGWQPYEQGLAAAKKEKKPVCLVFFTEWCPHCANYSAVFHDAKVVDQTKKFVMIRLDKDVHAPRDQYKYFYDEKDPASLLGGMSAALAKLK